MTGAIGNEYVTTNPVAHTHCWVVEPYPTAAAGPLCPMNKLAFAVVPFAGVGQLIKDFPSARRASVGRSPL